MISRWLMVMGTSPWLHPLGSLHATLHANKQKTHVPDQTFYQLTVCCDLWTRDDCTSKRINHRALKVLVTECMCRSKFAYSALVQAGSAAFINKVSCEFYCTWTHTHTHTHKRTHKKRIPKHSCTRPGRTLVNTHETHMEKEAFKTRLGKWFTVTQA